MEKLMEKQMIDGGSDSEKAFMKKTTDIGVNAHSDGGSVLDKSL